VLWLPVAVWYTSAIEPEVCHELGSCPAVMAWLLARLRAVVAGVGIGKFAIGVSAIDGAAGGISDDLGTPVTDALGTQIQPDQLP
jgi:hypothetical protein